MSNLITLTCPTCGAQLKVTGKEPQVKCAYCGNTVIVPDALRVKQPEPTRRPMSEPQVVVVQQPLPRSSSAYDNPPRARGSGAVALFGCLLALIITVVIFFSIFSDELARTAVMQVIQGATNTGLATRVLTFGDEGTGPGFFQSARHVAVDGKGNVYVSDYETLRIQRFDANGKFLNLWTIEENGQFSSKYGPDKIAADRDGNVYVIWARTLLKYDGATGKLLGKFAGEVTNKTLGWTEEFKDIALLPNGNLVLLSDNQNSDDIVKLDPHGRILSRVKKAVSTPKDDSVFVSSLHLAADGLGNTFIVDTFPSKPAVYQFSPDGKYLNRFGGKGKGQGQFTAASGIAVDGKGRVYVRDVSTLIVYDGEGRFIDTIDGSVWEYGAMDMAFGDKDELYIVNSKNKIVKLAIKDAK